MACHPIAGTEFSGPTAAIEGLFEGKTNIICEVEKTAFKLQEKALELFQKLGMRIRYMNPEAHDKHIAYVSHLSHISSFMLGKTVIEKEKNERDIFDMAGSGFESTVRLAKSSPAMWTPIFDQNKENVIETLEEYIQNLEAFKQKLKDDDLEGLYKDMQDTNKIKEILKGIPLNKL
jgi:prephenate dehydrogenase